VAAAVDDAVCLLEALCGLRVAPAVADGLITERPPLQPWAEAVRHRNRHKEDRREAPHLLLLYRPLCELAGGRHARVRARVADALRAVGDELGLP
jgi:hypothetical protein